MILGHPLMNRERCIKVFKKLLNIIKRGEKAIITG